MGPETAAPVAPPAGTMKLPVLVFGAVEVRRLKRELESLDDFMSQSALREPGRQAALPRMSRLLDALAGENHLNLLQAADRKQLKHFLLHVEQRAPKVHISFATDPSSAFTAKMVTWLRSNISPDTLLDIGLQPTIAAGCIVRTNNKIFDLSLRERFADSGKLLFESLEALGVQPAAAAPEAPAAGGPAAAAAQQLVAAAPQPAPAAPTPVAPAPQTAPAPASIAAPAPAAAPTPGATA